MGISRTGERVKLSDLSNIFTLRIPDPVIRAELIERLTQLPVVIYAEPNIRAMPGQTTPNDNLFGNQWNLRNTGQGGCTSGADIRALQAWDITTGSSSTIIGIIDGGVENWHEDLSGKVSGDAGWGWDGHGFAVAGVAAANTNNTIGIAGVDWNAQIVSKRMDDADASGMYNAITDAVTVEGSHIINNSWAITDGNGQPVNSATVRKAFANAYKLNVVAVAGMGNEEDTQPGVTQYPAGFGQGVIAVGNTNCFDQRFTTSSTGSHISVSAPGTSIFTTVPVQTIWGFYDPRTGTSFAAPHVSGLAGLLLAYNPNLYNDDIQRIIELSADEVGNDPYDSNGWNDQLGYGRVNAHQALQRLQSPYVLNHETASGGSVFSSTGTYTKTFLGVPGLADGAYQVKRYDVRKNVSFSWLDEAHVWGRGVATTGFSAANPNFGLGYTDAVSVSNSSATLRTFVYEVWTPWPHNQYLGWYPASPANVEYAYTVHGIPGTPPPPPPLQVHIDGPHQIQVEEFVEFHALTDGGTPPYSWQWQIDYGSGTGPWQNVGGNSSTYGHISYNSNDFNLRVHATDADNDTKVSTIHQVMVSWGVTASEVEEFELAQNHPNPFNPTTAIRYQLPEAATVSLAVYNVLGRRVATLVDGEQTAGVHTANWDGSGFASGLYFLRMQARGRSGEAFHHTRPLTLVK